jgi:eukaryotic-like serine/threonine-protein kinase
MKRVRILIALFAAALLIAAPAALAQVKPPQTAPVPNVEGMSLTDAQKALVSAGFNAVVSPENVTDPGKNNVVLKQHVPAGTMFAKGSRVPVVVGRYTAPATVKVPYITGKPVAEAQKVLVENKLNAEVTLQPIAEPQRNGVVIGQKIAAGTPVAPGSKVPVIVGKYTPPALVHVPNVTNMPLDAAQKLLTAAKLNAVVSQEAVTDPAKNNFVLRQQIVPGAEMAPGTKVPLVVGKYTPPTTLPVPSVTGKPLAEAQKALAANKLNAVVSPERVTDKSKDSVVLKQLVAPGTALAPGSQVSLVVGRYEAPSKVPNVVGMNWAQAQSSLIQAKLTPNFVSRSTTDKQKNNIVLEQSVRAGTDAAPGSQVNIVVGRYKTAAEIAREIQDRQHQPIPPDSQK